MTSDPAQVAAAAKVVLPGVGAFEDAIAELRRRDLVEPVLEAIDSGKPFLGICLGLQLLFDVSYENGRHEGLGVLAGRGRPVRLARRSTPCRTWAGTSLAIRRPAPCSRASPKGRTSTSSTPTTSCRRTPQVIATETDYGGPFCSMIWRDNVFATQFHPEKSQSDGLRMLQNFAEIV